ncbi:DUF2920 family protein [uncultured Campylobacter sp.]|uniref:DUF2920 family protein n=1 Tax=uncultured Campylobacter sp. TaxID=218934 RepID=UPI0034154FB8
MKFTKFFSCDDVELNIKRESMLEFKLYCDDRGPVKAIVFIVPGLGSDCEQQLPRASRAVCIR